MKKEFIPFKLAKKLKKLGFNESCFGKYDVNGELYYHYDYKNINIQNYVIVCSAPLYQQAFDWIYSQLNLTGFMISCKDISKRDKILKNLIKKLNNGTSNSAL